MAKDRVSIAERLEDGRLSWLARRLIVAEHPDILPDPHRAFMASEKAARMIAEGEECGGWTTLQKALCEFEAVMEDVAEDAAKPCRRWGVYYESKWAEVGGGYKSRRLSRPKVADCPLHGGRPLPIVTAAALYGRLSVWAKKLPVHRDWLMKKTRPQPTIPIHLNPERQAQAQFWGGLASVWQAILATIIALLAVVGTIFSLTSNLIHQDTGTKPVILTEPANAVLSPLLNSPQPNLAPAKVDATSPSGRQLREVDESAKKPLTHLGSLPRNADGDKSAFLEGSSDEKPIEHSMPPLVSIISKHD